MLFSSTVFMSRTLGGLWISVVFVFVLKWDVATNSQILNSYTERFDGDFDNFLKEMGTMVYKSPKTERPREGRTRRVIATPSPARYWKKKNTPKGILEDVLMMKLVSYYEDKYKLSHLEPTTTESITLNFDGRIEDDLFTKKINMYNYNLVDNEEALNAYRRQSIQSRPSKAALYGYNRRKQNTEKKNMNRIKEFQVPEVIIY